MTKTEKLRTQIEKMERALVEGEGKTTELEKALANAYADDADTDGAHQALTSHRERTADTIAALRQLDAKLETTAEKEREEIDAQITDQAEKNLKAATSEIERAARAMGKVLTSHISEGADPVVRQVIELSTEACESAYRHWAGEERGRLMPGQYPVPQRDETGRCFFAIAYSNVFFRDFAFHRTVDRNGTLVHDGPHRGATILDD